MEGKRAGLALAFVVALLTACGGATPATGGATASTTAAATGAPATSAAASATARASAAASATTDASAQLASILASSKNATYKVTYKITATGSGAGFSGEQTWYFKPPRARFDFAMDQGGQKITVSFFSLPDGQYYCFNAGAAQCLSVAGVGSPLDQNAAAGAQQALTANPSGYGATPAAARTIAGQQASCFDVNTKAAAAGGFDKGNFCYSAQGVPLLSSFSTAQAGSWTMEATAYSPTVSDSDFTLPAKPLSR